MTGWVKGPINPQFSRYFAEPGEVMTQGELKAAYKLQNAARKAMEVYGPPMWDQLHCRAYSSAAGVDDSAWLAGFAARLPCGDCRNHWLSMMAKSPPAWGPGFDYFTWTVERHNEVRNRLEQPEMLLVSARLHWSGIVAARALPAP